MTETAKVVEITQSPKSPKKVKPRIDGVTPTHIVDVWRLVERSLRDGGQTYPDTTEDEPEAIRSHLFTYLQQSTFAGLIARIGKKPVGVVLGHVAFRKFGRPSRYAFVYGLWVDPQYRGQGIGQALWKDYSEKLKRAGVYHWEATATEKLTAELQKDAGVPVQRLMTLIGGRI